MALVLLIGGAVAFAGQALDDGPARLPAASAPPPPALTLLAPSEVVTQRGRTSLVARRPMGLRADQAYRVRVYVNGAQVRERDLPTTESFELTDIPLTQGANVIGVSLVGDGGEGPRSTEVTIVRDDEPPSIRISQPEDRATIYADNVLVRGRTEAGASLTIARVGSGREFEASLGADGRFSALLDLRLGANAFVVSSEDAAGNRSSTRLNVVRGESAARLTLTISPEVITTTDLPLTVTLAATVRDEQGRLIDGAEVTFGVSPPTSTTSTYRVLTENGRARWSDVRLSGAGSTGVWLVTVSALLPSGEELRQNGSFTVE